MPQSAPQTRPRRRTWNWSTPSAQRGWPSGTQPRSEGKEGSYTSHVTDVKLKINDLDALEEAAEKCGLTLRRDQRTYKWYGSFVGDSNDYGDIDPKDFGKGEHALRLKNHQQGDYEIGLHAAPDGGFKVVFDAWGPGQKLTSAVGPQANALRREYAAAVATRKATATLARKGWRVVREDLPGNKIRLKLRHR